MDKYNDLKDTLALTVSNAISRIELLEREGDRNSIINEYKEWLEQDIEEEIWSLPFDWNYEKQEYF